MRLAFASWLVLSFAPETGDCGIVLPGRGTHQTRKSGDPSREVAGRAPRSLGSAAPASRLTRLAIGLSAAALAACHGPALAPEPARCAPGVPATAQHPIATKTAALAGDYELIQVRTQPAPTVTTGRLHLAPLDSSARAGAVGGAVRDLIGWLEPVGGDPAWRSIVASRNPSQPGVVLAGQHLRLGRAGDLEGYREHLTITAVAPEGFWGWWKAEQGLSVSSEPDMGRVLPDPAGYFCALRVAP